MKYTDPSGHDEIIAVGGVNSDGETWYTISDGQGNLLAITTGMDQLAQEMAACQAESQNIYLPLGQGAENFLAATGEPSAAELTNGTQSTPTPTTSSEPSTPTTSSAPTTPSISTPINSNNTNNISQINQEEVTGGIVLVMSVDIVFGVLTLAGALYGGPEGFDMAMALDERVAGPVNAIGFGMIYMMGLTEGHGLIGYGV